VARVDTAAAPVNISLEPANKICIVCADVVSALVEVPHSAARLPSVHAHHRPAPPGRGRLAEPVGGEGPAGGSSIDSGSWGLGEREARRGRLKTRSIGSGPHTFSWSREKGKFVKCVVDPTCQASRL
jgi:hypothetical protein